MRSNSASSINSKNAETVAIQKISTFITRFHAVLLPKAKGSGVFRDLSEDQQFLLNNIETENPLHSILAGCLAIDSCLSSICQSEQNMTDSILKGLTNLCFVMQKAQNQLIQSVEAQNLTSTKIQHIWKKMEDSNRNLIRLCHQLPYSQQNQEIKKQDRIMSQQDITFKISSMKLFQDKSEQQTLKRNSNVRQLQMQNYRLQQQLSFTEKKVVQLELKVNKLQEQKRGASTQMQRERNRKYSQKTHQQVDVDITSTWPFFNSPSSGSLTQEKQIQSLKDQIQSYQHKIQLLKQQFSKERKKLIREIRFLEEEIKRNDVIQDTQLILLLQELQEQIQALREQRRKDQRIIGQVQQKIQGMSISRQSRIRQGIRARESRIGTRYSQIYKEGESENECRSPSFRRSRLRDRIYTRNDEIDDVSKSSISMPKMQNYPTNDLENQRIKLRNQRLKKSQSKYHYYERGMENPQQMRYSFIQSQIQRPQRGRDRQQYIPAAQDAYRPSYRRSNLNQVQLVQSKLPKQSMIIRPQDSLPNNSKIRARDYETQPLAYPQPKFQSRRQILHKDQNKEKASKWQQITSTQNKGNERLKTSRI